MTSRYDVISKPDIVTCREIIEWAVARPSRVIKINRAFGKSSMRYFVDFNVNGSFSNSKLELSFKSVAVIIWATREPRTGAGRSELYHSSGTLRWQFRKKWHYFWVFPLLQSRSAGFPCFTIISRINSDTAAFITDSPTPASSNLFFSFSDLYLNQHYHRILITFILDSWINVIEICIW